MRGGVTLTDLYNTPWSPMSDRPNVGYPFRAPVVAKCEYINEHGAAFQCRVLTNRPRNRWWIEIERDHWLHLYLSTASKRKAGEWIAAIEAHKTQERAA